MRLYKSNGRNAIRIFGAFYRTIDSLIVAYGKGKLKCFLADLNAVLDVVSH